ncbi:hypothetical protein PMAYCL1PPCAC_10915, partial [Pristionchus mayeri]
TSGYAGDECELASNDVCIGYCSHGGSCTKKDGFPFCDCMQGWEGQRCEIRQQITVSMANLVVRSENPVPSIVYFPPLYEFSACGWVNFANDAGKQVIMSILGEMSMISITSSGLDLRENLFASWTTNFTFTNEGWNHFCLMCSVQHCDFYSNGILEFTTKKMRDLYYAAVLANPDDPLSERFDGQLNQIEIYSNISSEDVQRLYVDCNAHVNQLNPDTVVVYWSQFIAQFPTEDLYLPGQCQRTHPDRAKPIATFYPDNQYIIGKDLLTIVSWAEPSWSNNTEIVSVVSNFRTGDAFSWGDFHVVYTATDSSGNVPRCEFDVFIAANECALPEYSSQFGNMTVQDTISEQVGSY